MKMNILAFVDSHGMADAMREIERKAKFAEVIVCAGDFTIFERDMDKLLKRMDGWGKPVLVIPGNHESEAGLSKACRGLQNVECFHKKAKIINNVLFMGYGGGGFERKTPELEKFFEENKEFLKIAPTKIFFFHAPPYDTRLDLLGRNHNGSESEAKIISRYRPQIVVCGHFHENAGKNQKIEGTFLINPGPGGAVVEIERISK